MMRSRLNPILAWSVAGMLAAPVSTRAEDASGGAPGDWLAR